MYKLWKPNCNFLGIRGVEDAHVPDEINTALEYFANEYMGEGDCNFHAEQWFSALHEYKSFLSQEERMLKNDYQESTIEKSKTRIND